jgi:hypothetical protein
MTSAYFDVQLELRAKTRNITVMPPFFCELVPNLDTEFSSSTQLNFNLELPSGRGHVSRK